jgi:hypothetical protein
MLLSLVWPLWLQGSGLLWLAAEGAVEAMALNHWMPRFVPELRMSGLELGDGTFAVGGAVVTVCTWVCWVGCWPSIVGMVWLVTSVEGQRMTASFSEQLLVGVPSAVCCPVSSACSKTDRKSGEIRSANRESSAIVQSMSPNMGSSRNSDDMG